MLRSPANKIYYVLILGTHATDHVVLRKVMNKLFPQAIVESLYNEAETNSFLAHHSQIPDLILLDSTEFDTAQKDLLPRIKAFEDLQTIPLIIVGDESEERGETSWLNQGADAYFERSYASNSVEWLARNLQVKWTKCNRRA